MRYGDSVLKDVTMKFISHDHYQSGIGVGGRPNEYAAKRNVIHFAILTHGVAVLPTVFTAMVPSFELYITVSLK